MIILFVQIAILAAIVFQDIKNRKVTLLLFPALLAINIYAAVNETAYKVVIFSAVSNIVIVTLQFFLTWVWIRLRFKQKQSFFSHFIGLGDLLFIICFVPLFSPEIFIALLVSALVFSMLLWLIFKKRSVFNTVPLAGYMAVFYSGALIVTKYFPECLSLYAK